MASSTRRSIRLMEQSGQTDEERRLLREQQRNLQKKIQSNAEAMENPLEHVFSEIREENNNLFQKVFYTREAVLDGESLQMISEHAAKQIEGLDDVPRYDAMRLTWKLRQKWMRERFDWHTLGVQSGTCFNAIPSRIQFFGGPLHADFVPRTARAKRKRVDQQGDDGEEEYPDSVDNQETNPPDQLSAVDHNIQILNKVLRQRSEQIKHEIAKLPPNKRRKMDCEVNAIQYMFDPNSFTQTVENMFHFSFLVKNGGAKIVARPDGPKVAAVYRSVKKQSRQAIVSLTMQDWRELCRAYEVKKADVPHRTGSKQVHHFKSLPAVYPSELEMTCNASTETNYEEFVDPNDALNLETNHDDYVAAIRNDDELPDNRTTQLEGTSTTSPLHSRSAQASEETNRDESVETSHDEDMETNHVEDMETNYDEQVEPVNDDDSPAVKTASPVAIHKPSPLAMKLASATVETSGDASVETNHMKQINNDNLPAHKASPFVAAHKPSSLPLKLASAHGETNRDMSVERNHMKQINSDNSPAMHTASPVATYKPSSLTLKLASARIEANRDTSVETNHVKQINNYNSPAMNTACPVVSAHKPSSLRMKLASARIETNRDASVETSHVKPVNNDTTPDKTNVSPGGTYKFTSLTLKLARFQRSRKFRSSR